MKGILLTFTLILLYSLNFWVGAPQGTRTYGTFTWRFPVFLIFFVSFSFCFPKVLPVASRALPTTLEILSAAFKALSTASEVLAA